MPQKIIVAGSAIISKKFQNDTLGDWAVAVEKEVSPAERYRRGLSWHVLRSWPFGVAGRFRSCDVGLAALARRATPAHRHT
jgi:hypothetical protein